MVLSACAHADRASCATSKILSVTGAVRVRLLDAATGLPMPSLSVTLHSDNGATCIKAPCPTNSKTLELSADDQGFLLIPDGFLQSDADLDSESRHANVIEDAVCTDDTGWILELLPRGKDTTLRSPTLTGSGARRQWKPADSQRGLSMRLL